MLARRRSSRSIPTTGKPARASSVASGSPTLPRPTTAIRAVRASTRYSKLRSTTEEGAGSRITMADRATTDARGSSRRPSFDRRERRHERLRVVREQGTRVEEERVLVDAREHRRLACPQPRGELSRGERAVPHPHRG